MSFQTISDYLGSVSTIADWIVRIYRKGDFREWQKTDFLKGMELYETL
jgi:hypothetical protein